MKSMRTMIYLYRLQQGRVRFDLMEAVGSGLGMIGFDVNYGNPTFISHGENGYLIPIDKDDQDVEVITNHMVKNCSVF